MTNKPWLPRGSLNCYFLSVHCCDTMYETVTATVRTLAGQRIGRIRGGLEGVESTYWDVSIFHFKVWLVAVVVWCFQCVDMCYSAVLGSEGNGGGLPTSHGFQGSISGCQACQTARALPADPSCLSSFSFLLIFIYFPHKTPWLLGFISLWV